MNTWQMIESERAAQADALAALAAADWAQPSLCAGWTVRDVVAHLIDTATVTPARFAGRFIASGFRFPVMAGRAVTAVRHRRTDAELVALVRSRVSARSAPPGPVRAWLGETIVHGEDVFRALGPYREHPAEHLVAVAGFYAGSNALTGTRRRIRDVTLRATDVDWRHGAGPEISGPMIALVMAMTGRRPALDDLKGEGVRVLRARP